ncbi:EAL domain-containing protein [Virgibacillus sp. SK37]|uniref:sensor domain-containing protein n=1 Tax=Virgibacillus sp. SK37 TaxID=403957 RepID=UPI0004D17DB1|nr:EAL domain-containing protein [Virgibacillus sp. SK37]AIF42138.1 diguanylate cyclase [Virgibacillus sp. SK37]
MYETALNKAIKERLQDIELALNESSIVAITDSRGIIQFTNDKFCEISKYSREELIGSRQNIVNSGYHSREFFKEMWKTIGNGYVWKGKMKNKAKDGTYYWVDTTIVPFLKENGKPYQYISIRHDITKLKEYEETIKQMAFQDSLTLLPNRNSLSEWLSCQIMESKGVTVLFIDIDRFKSINDTFGHNTGDVLLKEVAKRLKSCVRSTDFIVRQGGDEFIIFLNGIVDRNDVMVVVYDILEQFRFPFLIKGEQISVTASIGISISEEKNDDYLQLGEILILQADTAMYHAKKQCGNTYCFNTDDQNDEMQRYYQVEQEVKKALSQNQFSVVYQPLVNLKNDQIIGVEALLRWYNPRIGPVSPAEFIPLLEELGNIISVGRWVLKTVCSQMKSWQDKGILIERAAVNVSPIQLRDTNFVSDVKQILKETHLNPKYLELEITEGTILQLGRAEKNLHELRALGIHISIDDFGTGYSSLSYLKKLPVNTLKIDKSFIHDLDIEDEVIVNTIINMGKSLKFKVLAEGIESEDQLLYLKSQDCHEGQGYYFSKPVEADEIQKIYQEHFTCIEEEHYSS